MNATEAYEVRQEAARLVIAELRTNCDYRALADRLGVSVHTLGRWAAGFSYPQLKKAEEITKILGKKAKGK